MADANARPVELLHMCRVVHRYVYLRHGLFPLRKTPIAQAKFAFNDRNIDTLRHHFVTFIHAFLASSLYSPFNFSCTTLNATSSKSISSFMWLAFKPVATLALGFLPAYITCLRS